MVRYRSRLSRSIRNAMSVLAVGVAATLAFSACAAGGSDENQGSDQNQVWIVPQDWGAIDPTRVVATNFGAILLVTEPLVLLNSDGGVESNLATQTQPDNTTYVYELREDAKFSDGNPVTIEDVKYSFDIQHGEGSDSTLTGNFADVESITTDDNKLVIKLSHPNVQFQVTVGSVGIVEKSVREKHGNDAGAPDKLNVGSGPYTVGSYKPGNELVLERNPNYWGDKPKVETLTLRLVQDNSARMLAVQSGDVTGAFEVPASEANAYGAVDGMQVISGKNPSIMLFNVNTSMAPWNDIHVRKAVAMAIDRDGIVASVLGGRGQTTPAIIPKDKAAQAMGEGAAADLFASIPTRFDLEAAKAELAQSATPAGFEADVVFSQAEQASSGLVGQAIAANLEPLGIKLNVQSLPDAQYTDAVFFQHTAPAAMVDFTTDSPDPISLPHYLANSVNGLAAGGYTNIADYSNPKVDQALNDYLATPSNDKATRGNLLGTVLSTMAVDQAYMPVYNSDYLAVVKDNIEFKDFDGFWWQRRWIDDVIVK